MPLFRVGMIPVDKSIPFGFVTIFRDFTVMGKRARILVMNKHNIDKFIVGSHENIVAPPPSHE